MTDSLKVTSHALAETERKLTRLAEAILEFSGDRMMCTDIVERCGDGCLYLANLDWIARLSSDYLEQLSLARKEAPAAQQPPGLKKRLERIRGRLIDIHDDLAAVPVLPPGSGSSADDPEVRALWDAVTALEDLLDDYFPGEEAGGEVMPGKVTPAAPGQDFELVPTN